MLDQQLVSLGACEFPLPRHRFRPIPAGTKVTIGVRAEDIVPKGHGQAPAEAWDFTTKVLFTEPLGSETLLIAELAGQEVTARMLNPTRVEPGQLMPFQINLARLHLFETGTGISMAQRDEIK
jgi:multiple sugar transport system ATP-binding protein